MRHTLFLTGASGSLGSGILERVVATRGVERVYALTHRAGLPTGAPTVVPVPGDITRPDLGLTSEARRELSSAVTGVLHAAALTRFDAPLDEARRVNVAGTENVLALARECGRLRQFGLVSTAYVAGRSSGAISEDDPPHECGFVNTYEQSKHEAERLVRRATGGMPVAIFRVSTIIGDSVTGDTGRPGAFHRALRFVYHGLAPMLPGTAGTNVDLIASDYASAAVAHLFARRFTPGTFHLCAAHDALPLGEFLDITLALFAELRPSWRRRAVAPPAITDLATFELFARSVDEAGDSVLRRWVGAFRHFAPQLAFPKRFDDSRCGAALDGSGIERPLLRAFYPRVVRHLVQSGWAWPLPNTTCSST